LAVTHAFTGGRGSMLAASDYVSLSHTAIINGVIATPELTTNSAYESDRDG